MFLKSYKKTYSIKKNLIKYLLPGFFSSPSVFTIVGSSPAIITSIRRFSFFALNNPLVKKTAENFDTLIGIDLTATLAIILGFEQKSIKINNNFINPSPQIANFYLIYRLNSPIKLISIIKL